MRAATYFPIFLLLLLTLVEDAQNKPRPIVKRITKARIEGQAPVMHDMDNALESRYKLAMLYKKEKNYQKAANEFKAAFDLSDGLASLDRGLLLFNWAYCLKASGMPKESMRIYTKCIEISPELKQCHFNLGRTLREFGKREESMEEFQKAIDLDDAFCPALNELGVLKHDFRDLSGAEILFRQCLLHETKNRDALVNLANLYTDMGPNYKEKAIEYGSIAVEADPLDPIAHNNLGYAYKSLFEIEKASFHFQKAVNLSGGSLTNALTGLMYTAYWKCDWKTIQKLWKRLKPLINVALERGEMVVTAYQAMTYPLSAEDMLLIAQAQAKSTKMIQSKVWNPRDFDMLHIGYISSDFRGHPLTQLMLHVFEYHTLPTHIYSTGPNDGSDRRKYIEKTAYSFNDVNILSDEMVVNGIVNDNIGILVDLNGWTKGERSGILSSKPAPIIISYMGFCGSSGTPWIDYIGTDRIASPPFYSNHYSEKFIYLPFQYFVTDYRQSFRGGGNVREPFLDDSKFIFCNFNQLYKIGPKIFQTWTEILKNVPNSVLWLLKFPEIGKKMLIERLIEAGLDPDRMVFSDTLPPKDHLRRLQNCNLFLDTPNVNAHTGAADCLWKGVPVLTIPGRKMASRVAASLVMSLNCSVCESELIVGSLEQYRSQAIRIATNTSVYESLKNNWTEDAPLFDTKGWVRYWEVGLGMVWELYLAGRDPMNVIISRI